MKRMKLGIAGYVSRHYLQTRNLGFDCHSYSYFELTLFFPCVKSAARKCSATGGWLTVAGPSAAPTPSTSAGRLLRRVPQESSTPRTCP
jgi:hypothetical protein